MASGRQSPAVAVLDGKLYVVGGWGNGFHDCLSSVERYDPSTNAWEVVQPMASTRDDAIAALLDGKLYAVGGYNDHGAPLSSVERYDPALDEWEAVTPMMEERFDHAVAVLDGKLYAVGGRNEDGYLSSVERYDPALELGCMGGSGADAWRGLGGISRCCGVVLM